MPYLNDSFTKTNEQFNSTYRLSYETCKNIYRTSALGKRIIEGLINYSLAVPREITVKDLPEDFKSNFTKTSNKLKQTEKIKETLYASRIYGTAGLFVNISNETDYALDYIPNIMDENNYTITFTVLDPMNLANSQVNLNPLHPDFLTIDNVKIENRTFNKKLLHICHPLPFLYLDDRTTLIPYAPPSVFYNMADLITDYDKAIQSLDALLYKAGVIIYSYNSGGKISGVKVDSIQASEQLLQQKRAGSIIAVPTGNNIQDFPINNVIGIVEAINKLEDCITKALKDTPASILFDREMGRGFSTGEMDKQTEIQTVDTYRQNYIRPLYEATDYFIMLKAWNNEFLDEMKSKYPELAQYENARLFEKAREGYEFEFGNLYPEPEQIQLNNKAMKMDLLLKLAQLGCETSDLQQELNDKEIFDNEIELREPQMMPQQPQQGQDDKNNLSNNNKNKENNNNISQGDFDALFKSLDKINKNIS